MVRKFTIQGIVKTFKKSLRPPNFTQLKAGIVKFFLSASQGIKNFFQFLKKNTVYRSYWGRGGFYKQALHITIVILTLIVFVSGLSTRLFGLSSANSIQAYNSSLGNVDVLNQGGSINTVLASNPNIRFKVTDYTVQSGDSLQSIADQFKVTKDTIKWSNMDKYGNYDRYTNESVSAGDVLHIPEVSGVLYTVNSGDTLDSILSKTSGDKSAVIGVNQLDAPDYSISGRSQILVPNGKLPAPAPPPPAIPTYTYRPAPPPGDCSIGGSPLNGISFSNPLCSPACAGYGWSRGFSAWHDGVDLPKYGGCPVRAACDGTVYWAGWGSPDGINYGEGYNVGIDCGNGVKTVYYHSDGNIWVSKGQSVHHGQDIMYMGCSGNCTGTHLHFGLRYYNSMIDPSPYVPY